MNTYDTNFDIKLAKTHCSCDFDFIKLIKNKNIEKKNIFHFGTGGHHIIGKEIKNNNVLGITCNREEYINYINDITKDPNLNKTYKCIFSDIYNLTDDSLPKFDIINLFHLCEYYDEKKNSYSLLNDDTLLKLMCNKLNPNGYIIFYKNSKRYKKTKKIINNYDGKLIKFEYEFNSLRVYSKL